MIETLEDRMHHVVDKATEVLTRDAQASDVVSEHLQLVLSHVGTFLAHYRIRKRQYCDPSQKSVEMRAIDVVDSTLIVMHALGIEPPTLEDIADLVDEFEDVIAQDGVLSSCVITRAASDAMISYFSDDGGLSEDLVLSLGEIICGAALLVQRVGGDFNELITRKV